MKQKIFETQLGCQIHRHCITEPGGMKARRFIRRYYGLESLDQFGRRKFDEEQILEIESSRGYRQQAINILAEILRLKTDSVNKWGEGCDFAKIPIGKKSHYEATLLYFDTIRILTSILEHLPSEVLVRTLREFKYR